MNESECVGGEFYWVLLEFYQEKPEYHIALFEDGNFWPRLWYVCGMDESIKYYPDDVSPYASTWISKIISHVERPPYDKDDFQDVGTTYEED